MLQFLPCFRSALICVLALAICGCALIAGKNAEPPYAKNPCIVLALPASGPYSPIASRIKAGAELARKELAQKGAQIRIENINTEAPDWIARLGSLPAACAVVGGPLQDKAYVAARNAGLLEQRAFFAFVPTLEKGDEGVRAWRFFPGPADQLEALTGFATDKMNIRTYGAFYPADNYGRRMTEMMEQTLKKRNIPLQKAGYNPKAPQTWAAALQPLILPRKSEDGRAVVPQTMFEALFVPDSWKNMDMITSALLANGEDRLALLGTTLWEQGLSGKQVPAAEKYSLAVFPGAWLPASAPHALRGRGSNFWNALGYDFINFGAAVALDMRPLAAHVTSRAQKAATGVRALAPMSWDNEGVAHQRMYLFQITPQGMTPLDENRFRQARTVRAERAALRMQGWNTIDPNQEEAAPGEEIEPEQAIAPAVPVVRGRMVEPDVQQASEPVVQQAREPEAAPFPQSQLPPPASLPPNEGVMSSTPRPSYKLSLPIRKQE